MRHPDGRLVHVLHRGLAERRGRERAVDRVCRVVRPLRVGQGAGAGARRRTRGGTRSYADGNWHDEAFRDPWVLADPDGDGWHMLITAARPTTADVVDRGVVGHAWSADLENWELREPLSEPGQGFGQLEVLQPFVVDGRQVLLFNCMVGDMPEAARSEGVTGGVWIADAKSPLGPYDIAGARVIDDPSLYVGKFITDRADRRDEVPGLPQRDRRRQFIGEITDPYAVTWDGDRLRLT